MMIIGRRYRKCDGRKCFPFGVKSGIYKGVVPSGFLNFDISTKSGKKDCIMNGGNYQLLKKS